MLSEGISAFTEFGLLFHSTRNQTNLKTKRRQKAPAVDNSNLKIRSQPIGLQFAHPQYFVWQLWYSPCRCETCQPHLAFAMFSLEESDQNRSFQLVVRSWIHGFMKPWHGQRSWLLKLDNGNNIHCDKYKLGYVRSRHIFLKIVLRYISSWDMQNLALWDQWCGLRPPTEWYFSNT